MKPNKIGQLVRFHTPYPDEDPNLLYIVLDLKTAVEKPRVDIKALNSGLTFTPINTVLLEDLEIAKIDVSDLIGHSVTIKKSDNSKENGIVVKTNKKRIILELSTSVYGVESNAEPTILNRNGEKHDGMLFLNHDQTNEWKIKSIRNSNKKL